MVDIEQIVRKEMKETITELTCDMLSMMPETLSSLCVAVFGEQEEAYTEWQCLIVETVLLDLMSECWQKRLTEEDNNL